MVRVHSVANKRSTSHLTNRIKTLEAVNLGAKLFYHLMLWSSFRDTVLIIVTYVLRFLEEKKRGQT